MHIKQKIYLDLEPYFIYDYIFFSAHLRFMQAQDNSYEKYNIKQKAKAMCLVNLLEVYQKSLEDLAAILLSLYRKYNPDEECDFQKKFGVKETPLIFTLINYKQGEASIKNTLDLFKRDTDVIVKIGIKNIENINITLLYPDINFKNFYHFLLSSLGDLGNDQAKRQSIYHKIKHGGVIVGDASFFSNILSQSPAAIYSEPKSFSDDDRPLVIHQLKYTEEEFVLMQIGVIKISVIIKVLLSVYLCKEYPHTIIEKGLKSPLEIFGLIDAKKYLSRWHGY